MPPSSRIHGISRPDTSTSRRFQKLKYVTVPVKWRPSPPKKRNTYKLSESKHTTHNHIGVNMFSVPSDLPFRRPRSKETPPSCASLTQVKFHLFFTQMTSIDATQLAGKRWRVVKTLLIQLFRVVLEVVKCVNLSKKKNETFLSQLIKKRSVKVASWLKTHWY